MPSVNVTLEIKVQPRAKKTAWKGWHEGAVKIAIAAAPSDGEANDELCRFLAREFGVLRKDVEILRGATSRFKVVRITGVSAQDVTRVLPASKPA